MPLHRWISPLALFASLAPTYASAVLLSQESAQVIFLPDFSGGHDSPFRIYIVGSEVDDETGHPLPVRDATASICVWTSPETCISSPLPLPIQVSETASISLISTLPLLDAIAAINVPPEIQAQHEGTFFSLRISDDEGLHLPRFVGGSYDAQSARVFFLPTPPRTTDASLWPQNKDLGVLSLACDPNAPEKTWMFRDVDGDGYGDSGTCQAWPRDAETGAPLKDPSPGFSDNDLDCDDERDDTYPGAPELYDLRDQNCDGFEDILGGQGDTRLPGGSLRGLVCGYFNKDDILDCAVSKWNISGMEILLGSRLTPALGPGPMDASRGRARLNTFDVLPTGSGPADVLARDIDDDGDVDLVVSVASGHVRFFINDGDAHFEEDVSRAIHLDLIAYAIAIADILPEAGPELLVLGKKHLREERLTAELRVYGLGDGVACNQATPRAVDCQPRQRVTDALLSEAGITTAFGGTELLPLDSDGDGAVDTIVVAVDASGPTPGAGLDPGVLVFTVGANGLLPSDEERPTNQAPLYGVQLHRPEDHSWKGAGVLSIAVAALDGRRGQEFVLGLTDKGIVWGHPTEAAPGAPVEWTFESIEPDSRAESLWVGDLDFTGQNAIVYIDVVGSRLIGSELRALRFIEGEWVDTLLRSITSEPMTMAVAHADGDGILDVVTGHYAGGRLQIHQATRPGRFPWVGARTDHLGGVWGESEIYVLNKLRPVDLNGDGLEDLLGLLDSNRGPVIFWNLGGSYSAPEPLSLPTGGMSAQRDIQTEDINRDGCPDVVTSDGNDGGSLHVGLSGAPARTLLPDGRPSEMPPGQCSGQLSWTLLARGSQMYGLRLEDLNDDESLDLAFTQDESAEAGHVKILWDVGGALEALGGGAGLESLEDRMTDVPVCGSPRGIVAVPRQEGPGRDLVVSEQKAATIRRIRLADAHPGEILPGPSACPAPGSGAPTPEDVLAVPSGPEDILWWAEQEVVVVQHLSQLSILALDDSSAGLHSVVGDRGYPLGVYIKGVSATLTPDGVPTLLITQIDGAVFLMQEAASEGDQRAFELLGSRATGTDIRDCVGAKLGDDGISDIVCSGYYRGMLVVLKWLTPARAALLMEE